MHTRLNGGGYLILWALHTKTEDTEMLYLKVDFQVAF